MALITRSADARLDTNQARQIATGNLYAGEVLDAAAPCYIKSADGKVYMTDATAANEAAEVVGFTPRAYVAGEAITLFGQGSRFRYGSGLTPGAVFYAGATPGRVDGAATVGDSMGVAMAINDTDIVVTRTSPVVLNAVADGALTGTKVGTVAESNVVGGIPLVYEIPITAGANADTDIVVTHKIRVLDAHLILRGAGVASATLQVKNGSTAITDAMAASGSDKAIVRAASIDDASYEIAAGGTLRVTGASGATQPAALVVVSAIRVA